MSAGLPRPDPVENLTGPQRAAALLMLLGEEHGAALWPHFTDREIGALCAAMSELGPVRGEVLESLVSAFGTALGGGAGVTGTAERTESLISKFLPAERVASVMAEVRGAAGRQVWRRMSHVPPDLVADFLKQEHPQTVAVILSRIGSDLGGRVLALLPDRQANDVVARMLRLGPVKPEAVEDIEEMLYRQFLAGGPRKPERDPYEMMADRFNAFDRPTETRFLAALEASDRDAAQRIREKMFTFDDLSRLDAAGAQTVLRVVDKDVLARALKGATEEARAFFLGNMSQRAAKNLKDEMEALGPIRLKEVDEAQSRMVAAAKELVEKGEIRINKSRSDEELIG